jgi:hypothetical protein
MDMRGLTRPHLFLETSMSKPFSGARRRSLHTLAACAAVACAALGSSGALAQAYPDRPVKIVVGFRARAAPTTSWRG